MNDSLSETRSRRPGPLLFVVVLAHVALLGWLAWLLMHRRADHWAAVERGEALMAQGRPDLAFAEVANIRDEAPGAAEAMTLAGRSLLAQGQVAIARQALERALKLKPEQPDAAKMLAAVYFSSGNGPRGLELLKSAAKLDPADFRPWYAMGKVYQDLGEFGEAADAYGQALSRKPTEPEATEARIGRIRAMLDSSQNEEATADLDQAIQNAPRDPRVLALKARQARALGRPDEAMALATRALEIQPDEFDALLVRGQILLLRGERELALAALEQASQKNKNHLGTLQLLLQVRSQLGQNEAAAATRERLQKTRERLDSMNTLTKLMNQDPNDPLPRYQMGQLAVEGGLETLAYQCFQAALDIDPNFKLAREALEKLPPQASGPTGGTRP